MQSILIPVAVIVRNPLSKGEGDKLLEVTGWVDCLLSPIASLRHEGSDVRLQVALSLKVPDASSSIGQISGAFTDRVKRAEGGTAVLERHFTVHGRPEGAALSLVVKIFANHAAISHMRLVAHEDTSCR